MKLKRTVSIVVLLCFILCSGCLLIYTQHIELVSLSAYPTELLTNHTEDLYYCYPLSLWIPIKVPFTIDNITIHERYTEKDIGGFLIYIYDPESTNIGPGGGYMTVNQLSQIYQNNLKAPNHVSMNTLGATIFILIPPDIIVEQKCFYITMEYSWFGILKKESSVIIK